MSKVPDITLAAEVCGWPDWRDIADQVERGHTDCFRSACCYRLVAQEIRDQTKPPKPAEPTGWGAVVEDRTGAYWTLYAPEAGAFINYREGKAKYADIEAVRIVSEGVQP